MQPGDVMYFKKPDYARVHIEEMPIYEVEVGAMGGQVAIKIVDAIAPQESEQT